jgi:hypothetical protein
MIDFRIADPLVTSLFAIASLYRHFRTSYSFSRRQIHEKRWPLASVPHLTLGILVASRFCP